MNRVVKGLLFSLLVVCALAAIGRKIARDAFELSAHLWQKEILSVLIEMNPDQPTQLNPVEHYNPLTQSVAQRLLAFGRPHLIEEFAKTLPPETRDEFLRRYKAKYP